MRNYISQPCISCALGLLPLVGTTAANQAGRKAVQHMLAGKKRRVWIPEELAYKGAPGLLKACSSSISNASKSRNHQVRRSSLRPKTSRGFL